MNLFTLPEHAAARVFPMLGDKDLQALAEDIRTRGLREPITLIVEDGGWSILDGRNRLRACAIAGVTPRHEFYSGEDPVGFVVSKNLMRRHLDESQRSWAGLEVEKIYAAEAKTRQLASRAKPSEKIGKVVANLPPPSEAGKARDKAAALLNVSPRQIQKAKAIAEAAAPEVIESIRAGEITISDAMTVLALSHDDQRAMRQKALSGEQRTMTRAARAAGLISMGAPPVLPARATNKGMTLTKRDQECAKRHAAVLHLHEDGLSTTEISKRLQLPDSSVSSIKNALGVSGRASGTAKLWADIEHLAAMLSGAAPQVRALANELTKVTSGATNKEIASCLKSLSASTAAIKLLISELRKHKEAASQEKRPPTSMSG